MLNEDYFTIHSSKVRGREQSGATLSRVESGFLSRVSTKVDEESELEEIRDIPSLMHALKKASIDREKISALKKFIQEGGDEIYYLNDKVRISYLVGDVPNNSLYSRSPTSCACSFSKPHAGNS